MPPSSSELPSTRPPEHFKWQLAERKWNRLILALSGLTAGGCLACVAVSSGSQSTDLVGSSWGARPWSLIGWLAFLLAGLTGVAVQLFAEPNASDEPSGALPVLGPKPRFPGWGLLAVTGQMGLILALASYFAPGLQVGVVAILGGTAAITGWWWRRLSRFEREQSSGGAAFAALQAQQVGLPADPARFAQDNLLPADSAGPIAEPSEDMEESEDAERESPPVAGIPGAPPGSRQRVVRGESSGGEEVIWEELVLLSPAQSTYVLHFPFSPPLTEPIQGQIACEAGFPARVRLTQIAPFGARAEVRWQGAGQLNTEVLITASFRSAANHPAPLS